MTSNKKKKENTIFVKSKNIKGEDGHITQFAAAAARDTGRERESERRGQSEMKDKMMEVERKVKVKRR